MATRQQIAVAARRLFAERGYLGTTIAAIAAEADIPAPTIYSAFGTKAKILEEITRLWIGESGTQQQHEDSLAQPDPVRRLHMAAHWHTRQMELGHDVITIYQEAARADPEMALVLKSVLDGRERAIGKLIGSLTEHLAAGLTRASAMDLFVTCTLSEIYRSLVLERGWPLADYERWLGELLVAQLLSKVPPEEGQSSAIPDDPGQTSA
jgi:AcrR family transcriptional regulator